MRHVVLVCASALALAACAQTPRWEPIANSGMEPMPLSTAEMRCWQEQNAAAQAGPTTVTQVNGVAVTHPAADMPAEGNMEQCMARYGWRPIDPPVR